MVYIIFVETLNRVLCGSRKEKKSRNKKEANLLRYLFERMLPVIIMTANVCKYTEIIA